jgi:phosphoribosylanthranilate isomerase
VHRTRIKFCGITRAQDAIAAAAAGADAIGLVFHPSSPRNVSIETAMQILRALPALVTPVALFVNMDAPQVRQLAMNLGIRTVQLHGDEPPDYLEILRDFSVIKAIPSDVRNLASVLTHWQAAAAHYSNLKGVLLETPNTAQPGGSGVENDWAGIESILRSKPSLPPIVAAGGLTPENVGGAIQRLRPYAVDVSSGIEESKGIKSVDKMQRFVNAVRNADSGRD